jgi:hypothetical protein
MKVPGDLRRVIYLIFKAGILSGALFFISAQLIAQDTLRPQNPKFRTVDSALVAKKKQSLRTTYHPDTLVLEDSSSIVRKPKKKWIPQPERATILSAVLPGLGQAYNRKYWKIPIIYAAGGALYYFYYINDTAYTYNRRLYEEETARGDPMNNADTYKLNYEEFKKKRDYKLILFGVLYVANIVDAMADAYFATYDISDDLAFKIRPSLMPEPSMSALNFSYGIKFNLYF